MLPDTLFNHCTADLEHTQADIDSYRTCCGGYGRVISIVMRLRVF